MTSSAPIERTISTFRVLQTAVTWAPRALAICTANVPDAAAGPVDQHPLAGLEPALVAKALERGVAGHRHGGSLLERQVGRLGRDVVRLGADVLREGAAALAEDLVAGLELGHVRADRLDRPGQVDAGRAGRFGRRRPSRHPDQVWAGRASRASRTALTRRGADADEDAVVVDDRAVDLLGAEDVGGPVRVADDRLHGR